MQNLSGRRENFAVATIGAIFALSFVSLDASKYDTADKIWFVLLIGIASLFPLLLIGTQGIREHPRRSLLVAAFVMLLWISYAFSQTRNFGFSEIIVISSCALNALLLTHLSATGWDRVRKILLGVAVTASLYGFFYFPAHGEARMAGLFFDAEDPRHFFPNALANFLLYTWPLIFLYTKKSIGRVAILSLLASALFLTFSRGAWAVFIIQWAVFLLSNHHKKKMVAIFLISAAVVFGATSGLITIRNRNFSTVPLGEKITFQNSEAGTSFRERLDFWKGSLLLSREKPFTGYGPMSFRYAYPRHQQEFLGVSDHPHNWILRLAAENGLPAALTFLALLGTAFFIGIQRRKKSPTVMILGIALFGGVLHNMIDYNMNFVPHIAVFFMLLSHMYAYAPEKKSRVFSTPAVWITVAILFATTMFSVRELALALERKSDPENLALVEKTFMARNYFLGESEKFLKEGKAREASRALEIHLMQNPLDARAQYFYGNAETALALDPANYFAYYRLFMETGKPFSASTYARLSRYLVQYDRMLEQNIHYTAFGENPEEAAKIYELMGDKTKAQEIREKAREIRESFAKNAHFNKELFPRTLRSAIREFFKK